MWNRALVLGMHRSGTSAVAAAIAQLGAPSAASDDLLGAALENPLGFSEVRRVMEFNDSSLGRRGITWDSAGLDSPRESPVDAEVGELRNLLLHDFAEVRSFKDPRISLLLPLWRAALLDRFAGVVSLRDPREVVWSLVVRNGFSPGLAAALWIAYNRNITLDADGIETTVVDFRDLTEAPQQTLTELADFLVTAGVLQGVDAEQVQTASKGIHPDLRRETFPSWLEDHPLVNVAQKIYLDLGDRFAPDVFEDHLTRKGKRARYLCQEIIDAHRSLVEERRSQQTLAAEHEAAVTRLQHEMEMQRATNSDLAAQVSHLESQLRRQSEVEQLASSIRSQLGEVESGLRSKQESLEALLISTLPDLQGSVGQLTSLPRELDALGQRIERAMDAGRLSAESWLILEQQKSAHEHEADNLRTRVGAIEASTSFKVGLAITWPIRRLKVLLRRH